MKILHRGRTQILVGIMLYSICLLVLTGLKISFSLYYFSIIAVVLFVLLMELSWGKDNRRLMAELKDLDWLLSEVRHRYYIHGMVDEAVEEVFEICKNTRLKKQIFELYEVLCSADIKLAKQKFKQANKNRYFRMFLTLSLTVMEFGDQTFEGQSLYLKNLKRLREEIHMELKSNQTLRHHFSGLTFLIVVPVTTLGAIESWGIHNLPELVTYYAGTYQILFYLILFLLTVGLYYLFFLLKSPVKVITKKHPWLKSIAKRNELIKLCRNYALFFPNSWDKQKIALIQVGETLEVSEFLCKRLCSSMAIGLGSLVWGLVFLYPVWKAGVLLILVTSLLVGFYYPRWILQYRKKLAKDYMEDEVFQFQAILMMVMAMERISTYELLEMMEEFGIIFKNPLKQCLLDYDVGQKESLIQLKENTYCEAFHKLIDNLMMCDEIGVTKALDEVVLEMQFYSERRQQLMKYQLEQKGVLCRFLSFLPLVVTIAFYLILPFVTVSLSKLMEISDAIATGK